MYEKNQQNQREITYRGKDWSNNTRVLLFTKELNLPAWQRENVAEVKKMSSSRGGPGGQVCPTTSRRKCFQERQGVYKDLWLRTTMLKGDRKTP